LLSNIWDFEGLEWHRSSKDMNTACRESLLKLSQKNENSSSSKRKIFLIDIDGTISEDIRNEEGLERMIRAEPITSSIEAVNELYELGHYICLFTARTDAHEQVTREWLKKNGVKYHQLILNKPRKLSPFTEYHLIDDSPVRATTFKGKFTGFVKKETTIEVFDE
jgi:hypothetical protein